MKQKKKGRQRGIRPEKNADSPGEKKPGGQQGGKGGKGIKYGSPNEVSPKGKLEASAAGAPYDALITQKIKKQRGISGDQNRPICRSHSRKSTKWGEKRLGNYQKEKESPNTTIAPIKELWNGGGQSKTVHLTKGG